MEISGPEENGYNIKISSDEALVLFEFLSRYSDLDKLTIEHPAESQALWNLCCSLEEVLTEPFSPEFNRLLQQARNSLIKEK